MSDFNVEQLLKRISELEAELKSTKKYGLVWDKEKTKEDIVLKCEKFIPILLPEKSKNISKGKFNNILIEGDNFHALTALNYIENNSIDFIYIDPPYNTGQEDFIYNDNYVDKEDEYRHSKWLNFMQKRLLLARNLLKDSGMIFISIDDNELYNLKLLCDSIFGEINFESNICVETGEVFGTKAAHVEKTIVKVKDYILVYSKNKKYSKCRTPLYEKMNELYDSHYNVIISNGNKYSLIDFLKGDSTYLNYFKKYSLNVNYDNISFLLKIDTDFKNKFYNEISKVLYTDQPLSKKMTDDELNSFQIGKIYNFEGKYIFKTAGNKIRYYQSFIECLHYTDDYQRDFCRSSVRGDLWKNFHIDMRNIDDEGAVKFKNGKKPVRLLRQLLKWFNEKNALVLDFFAGSGTTGEAVLEQNKEDGGHRKFILCTNNENNICNDVTYQRLKTVINGIRPDGSKYSDGIPANLYYFKTDFIEDQPNTEQARYNLVEKVDSLLCKAEDIMEEIDRNNYSSHYANGNKHLFIYNDYYNQIKFNEFKQSG